MKNYVLPGVHIREWKNPFPAHRSPRHSPWLLAQLLPSNVRQIQVHDHLWQVSKDRSGPPKLDRVEVLGRNAMTGCYRVLSQITADVCEYWETELYWHLEDLVRLEKEDHVTKPAKR